jgi:nucleoid DNA-binding protein
MSTKISRSDIASTIAERAGITQYEAKIALDSLVNIITKELAVGREVGIKGLGTFCTRMNAATRRPNPQTGGTVDVPEKWKVKFRPGSALRKYVEEAV